MATKLSPSPTRRRRRRFTKRGNCRLWLKMQDDRHDKALNLWSDARHKGDLTAEIRQLKKAKIRLDMNPRYPGAVGVAVIYYHQNGPHVDGTPVASFEINKGWTDHP